MQKTENEIFIFDRPCNINWKFYVKKILYSVFSTFYRIRLCTISNTSNLSKKYNVSICAIFKNEAQYLKEWIEFNHLVGVDHFYLYNNNSEDDYQSVLAPYIEVGLVTLLQWEKNHAQMECYRDGISRFRNDTKWMGFIDVDEFIVPIKNNNIYDFLKKFEKKRGSVVCYWKMFCSSGKMDRDRQSLVTESFNICWPKMDTVGKCFYNTNFDIDYTDPRNKVLNHLMWTNYKGRLCPPVNSDNRFIMYDFHKVSSNEIPVQINHYFTKSYQEYAEKRAKGDVYFKINPHDEEYFYRHEMLCTDSDYKIFRFLIKLKNVMEVKEK